MLRGLASSRFALYHHVVRREVDAQTQGAFPDAFSADLDATWSERLAARKLYVNDLFLTIVRRPLQGHEAPLSNRKIRETLGFVEEHNWRKYVKA